MAILEGIVSSLPTDGSILEVENPMNREEKFSERWEADRYLYTEFKDWITEFRNEWRAVNQAAGLPGGSWPEKSIWRKTGE